MIRQWGSVKFVVIKEKEIGGLGEVIFIEIIECDPGFERWLTCMEERKWGRSEKAAIYPSLHSAN